MLTRDAMFRLQIAGESPWKHDDTIEIEDYRLNSITIGTTQKQDASSALD
jgi:hypothetical protein